MTHLTKQSIKLPGSRIGSDNPLPQIWFGREKTRPLRIDASVPEEFREFLGYGVGASPADPCLPYLVQDSYSRSRGCIELETFVLENSFLRAEFLAGHGMRLWSLHDKQTGTDLIYKNPVFQPANLGIRNAWFSGGIEWNCGVRGHTPLGCSPLFAGVCQHPEGWPVLRAWEYERIRGVPFQIDFILPPDSAFLHVMVSIANPGTETIPFYWWTNIAVRETEHLRVLAPSTRALCYDYSQGLKMTPAPVADGVDFSYPPNSTNSRDFFFVVDDATRPWICAADGSGNTLIQTSTAAMRGRKLFVWGNQQGGRQWQQFLTEGDNPYVEIQAGISRTQYESFPLHAGEALSWMESFGGLAIPASATHGPSWEDSTLAIAASLDAGLPAEKADAFFDSMKPMASIPPQEILQKGSGWGALENRRRATVSLGALPLPGAPFPQNSLGPDQAAWIALLQTGTFPENSEPVSWMVHEDWKYLVQEAAENSWLGALHAGVFHIHQGRWEDAQIHLDASLAMRRSMQGLRCLGVVKLLLGDSESGCRLLLEAMETTPDNQPLAIECLTALINCGLNREADRIIYRLPQDWFSQGRMRVLKARTCLAASRLEEAEGLLAADLVVPDLQEGDTILSDLWMEIQTRRESARSITGDNSQGHAAKHPKLPAHLDFRQAAVLEPVGIAGTAA